MMKLLVANRGEIARRIFRTARRMGIATVAVFSDADADAPFVREADETVRLGPAPSRESYLSVERIIAAARESGATLVHPGYGFLAEDPALAQAVLAAGLRWIGPEPQTLALFGSKAAAKVLARKAGVPVLPGYDGEDQRDDAFLDAARETGFPLLVKPIAGGGGIGMQRVSSADELRDSLARARRIAAASFGDERVLIERLVPRPRHVEVQLLADEHSVVALGERDCSLQRRNQKVVEETPAPSLTRAQRGGLEAAAVALAKASGYRSAGTAEFVVDGSGAFFFIEVNARLQVEHPVTELVWNVDLVEQQIRVALGERIALDVRPNGRAAGAAGPRGHAIQARVYAEDPRAGFLPASGVLAHVRWPEGVRVDAGYEEGSIVTGHYDPLLAKIVAHGNDRAAALDRLARALDETELLGVRTNLGFLRALLAHSDVRAGRVDTELIERERDALVRASAGSRRAAGAGRAEAPGTATAVAVDVADAPETAIAVAAAAAAAEAREGATDPWRSLGAWRIGEGAVATIALHEGAGEILTRVIGDGPFDVVSRVAADGPFSVSGRQLVRGDEPHRWTVDGAPAAAARVGSVWHVACQGGVWELDAAPRERGIDALAGSEVTAPMPGVVLAAHATADRHVKRGELLFVVEAMKMELRVEAPADGVVRRVLASVGDQVARGQRLAEFEPAS